MDINPTWRNEQRLMKREGGSLWLSLDIHRQNGFLNLLMCLKWWHDAMEVPSLDWEEAVEDIMWVLQQMKRYVLSPCLRLPI
jgi:hypothetical protein